MKFNSLLLAAASLFALANAASSVSPQGLDPVALAGPDPARCGTYCHQPWLKCVADHGGGEYAEWFCNCKQFNNPDNFCRHSGCVQPPKDCSKEPEADGAIAGRAATEPAPVSVNVDPARCDKYCHQPWLKCVADHGGGSTAEWFCNCKQFENPHNFCRHSRCVQPPKDCSNAQGLNTIVNRAATIAAPGSIASIDVDPATCDTYCHQPWLKFVAEHDGGPDAERGCNCAEFSDPDNFCRHSGCVQPPQARSRKDEPADVAIPASGSVTARAATDGCYDNCQVPFDKCMSTCNAEDCWFCEIICNCRLFGNENNYCRINNCVKVPTSCPGRKRELDSAVVGAHSEDLIKKDDELATGSVAVPPPPMNPCVICQYAINACGKDCVNPHACDDTCRCYHKMFNINCLECGVRCHCGHACPRLALKQRRSEISAEELENMTPVKNVLARVPNPCVICEQSIKICKKPCNGVAGCENDCNCKWNKNFNCKECSIPCNS